MVVTPDLTFTQTQIADKCHGRKEVVMDFCSEYMQYRDHILPFNLYISSLLSLLVGGLGALALLQPLTDIE